MSSLATPAPPPRTSQPPPSHAPSQNRRTSMTSISDEILGDDDLRNVDAVFESLLNADFVDDASELGGGSVSNRVRQKVGKGPRYHGHHSSVRGEEVSNHNNNNFASTSEDAARAMSSERTAKFLPRQQTWAGEAPQPQRQRSNQSPSPTQSEYDTACDPWEDY